MTLGYELFAIIGIVAAALVAVVLFSVPKHKLSTPHVILLNFGAVGSSTIAFWASIWLVQNA